MGMVEVWHGSCQQTQRRTVIRGYLTAANGSPAPALTGH
jgi:hypothetical protein